MSGFQTPSASGFQSPAASGYQSLGPAERLADVVRLKLGQTDGEVWRQNVKDLTGYDVDTVIGTSSNHVFVDTVDNALVVLDKTDGSLVATKEGIGAAEPSHLAFGNGGVLNDKLITFTDDFTVGAYKVQGRSIVRDWQYDGFFTDSGGERTPTRILIARGRIFAKSEEQIAELDPKDGSEKWFHTHEVNGKPGHDFEFVPGADVIVYSVANDFGDDRVFRLDLDGNDIVQTGDSDEELDLVAGMHSWGNVVEGETTKLGSGGQVWLRPSDLGIIKRGSDINTGNSVQRFDDGSGHAVLSSFDSVKEYDQDHAPAGSVQFDEAKRRGEHTDSGEFYLSSHSDGTTANIARVGRGPVIKAAHKIKASDPRPSHPSEVDGTDDVVVAVALSDFSLEPA